jgi:hypothetical protein
MRTKMTQETGMPINYETTGRLYNFHNFWISLAARGLNKTNQEVTCTK